MLGLCGAHRTGKTTLARVFSEQTGLPFVVTTTSQVFVEYGFDPKKDYPFRERLFLQDKILSAAEAIWASAPRQFITDRTPIDMLAYTLADVQRANLTTHETELVMQYKARCEEVTNRFFAILFIVQPGIKVVEEDGKAPGNEAYMEHFNALVKGLVLSENITAKRYTLPRSTTNIARRVECLQHTVAGVLQANEVILKTEVLH